MATQTFRIASFAADSVRVEIDVNNANWRVQKARCINDSDAALKIIVYELGTQIYTAIAPAQQTTEWNVNPFQLGWDSVDGGLILGNYSFGTQWPAEV
jgi:hypothetical protein